MTTRRRVFAGYAGWGSGQLEDELAPRGLDRRARAPRRRVHRGAGRALARRAAPQGRHLRARRADAGGPVRQLSSLDAVEHEHERPDRQLDLAAAGERPHLSLDPRLHRRRRRHHRARRRDPFDELVRVSARACGGTGARRSGRTAATPRAPRRPSGSSACAAAGGRSGSSSSSISRCSGSSSSHWFQSSADRAAGPQHAVHLGERLLRPEPVERLPDRDRVDGRVRERDRLRAAGERLGLRHDALEQRAHRVARLDGDDGGAEGDELARQLPGARGEIEHAPSRARCRSGRRASAARRPRTSAARARTARPTASKLRR